MKEITDFASTTHRLVLSALIIAIYIALMGLTASFAFGAVQIRLATALYSLSYLFPFLVLPIGLANALSNFMFGGLGVIDVLGGLLVGVLTPLLVYFIRRFSLPEYLIAIPIIIIPGFIIPTYLHSLLSVPYWPLAVNLLVGQVIPAILGVVLVKALKRRKEVFKW